MAVSVSRLRSMGLAKESTLGTPVTTPTRYLNGIPPDSFTPMIEPLPSKGIEALRSMYPKITQGPGTLNGMKVKLEIEPDNIGEILQATFGLDTLFAAGAAIIIYSGINDAIDFTISSTQYHAFIPNGTYNPTALEAAIAAAMNAAHANSFAASVSGGCFVISGTSAFVLNWATGSNNATNAALTLGWTKTDTISATSQTAPNLLVFMPGTVHSFQPQNVAQLPTYTWWFDKYLKYPLFAGAMVNKFDLTLKAKSILEADIEWVGVVYDDVDGVSESTSFSSLKPFVWSNAVLKIDGVVKGGYDNFKLTLNNDVKADHALNNSIWPYTIYSQGFTPDVSAELFFEDTTQYQKFLSGATAHLNIVLTCVQNGVTYSLTIDIPQWYYKSANLTIPSNGPLKIPFTGMAQYSSAAGYDVKMVLMNDVTSQY